MTREEEGWGVYTPAPATRIVSFAEAAAWRLRKQRPDRRDECGI